MKSRRSLITLILGISLGSFLFVSCMTPSRMNPYSSEEHTIAVNGVGVVEAAPDTARLMITISELRETTSAAQSTVNKKIAEVLTVSYEAGIGEDEIHTSSISFNSEYDWTDNGRVLKGQRVRQTLSITISGIDEAKGNLASLLDGLGTISGIEISSLNFYVKDTEQLYEQARELAFTKARQKAQEYAALGDVSLGTPRSISEYSSDNAIADTYGRAMKMEAAMADYSPSQVPTGSYSVSVTVSVEFLID